MRVLYVTGACLFNNTSANMSHNAYVQGLIENGVELHIIMASDSWGERDNMFPAFESAHYYIYGSVSIADRIKSLGKRIIPSHGNSVKPESSSDKSGNVADKSVRRRSFREGVKKLFYLCFKQDPLYPLHKTWLRNSSKFKSDKEYDLVVSNSSPSASHRLVADLLDKRRVTTKRWVQIWEDPWYYDLYTSKTDIILNEEHDLLRRAQEILYVSPLTLKYQMEYFPDCADKMGVIPLPAFSFSDALANESGEVSFGYFGDYYSHVRNLQPFYDALAESGMRGYIYGDTDLRLASTDMIDVSGRVTLDILGAIQDKTSVLVHLSNLRGGQIPGKIYHYSATAKPIIFILDGTEEEQRLLKEYFRKFDRFVFCKNEKEDLARVMALLSDKSNLVRCQPVKDFMPKIVVKGILKRQ